MENETGNKDFTFGGDIELNKKLADEGFDMKIPEEHKMPTNIGLAETEVISDSEQVWKDRYFKLLEVVVSFKK